MPNLGKEYLATISPDLFFVFQSFFFIFTIFFSFSLTRDHMGANISSSDTSNSIPKSCILIGRVSAKVVQRILKFQILDLCHFLFSFFSLTWDHIGVKVLNDITSERTHQLCSPKFIYTHREGLYQSY